MKAIEFTSNLKNKTITLPEYISGHIENSKKVRVILLLEDNNNDTNVSSQNEGYKAAGKLKDFSSPDKVEEEKTAWEKHLRKINMEIIDVNYILRYLLKDIDEQYLQAASVIENHKYKSFIQSNFNLSGDLSCANIFSTKY
jgi:hypothetical protein